MNKDDDSWQVATEKEHERRLKGIEAFTFLVALLAASFAILGFIQGSEEPAAYPIFGWVIISSPIWFVSYIAFCSTCHYLFDAEVTYDYKGSGFAFSLSVIILSILLDALDLINLIP